MPPTTPPEQSNSPPEFLVIGRILRPHGIRGELRVQIFSNYPERFKFLEEIYLTRDATAQDSPPSAYTVERSRLHQEYAILKLEGIDSREAADTLRDLTVMVTLADAVPLEAGEYYFYQLIGLEMVTDTGEVLGTVSDILETGANEVYIVQSARYGELLIPAIESVVQEIDLPNQRIVITPLEGLLPDDS